MVRALSARVAASIGLAVISAVIVSLVVGGAVADAAPARPSAPAPSQSAKVPGTSCNLGQVERALAKEDPATWKRINAHPRVKRAFETRLTMTKEQRQQRREQWQKKHPNAGHHKRPNAKKHPRKAHPGAAKHRQTMAKVKQTCSKY